MFEKASRYFSACWQRGNYFLPPHVRKSKLFRILLLFFLLHSLILAAACIQWSLGSGVSSEQCDCCKKGLLLSVPAAQVLICSDVHVFGLASKLCDL